MHLPLDTSANPAFLFRRQAGSELDSVRTTLSSWDNCMAKAYCKWPVIVVIVLGSLILASILFCLFRCLCCGLECCFGCFRCCNACCPSPRRKNDRSSYAHPPQQQQQQPYYPPQPQPFVPMMYGGASPAPAYSSPGPQFAAFDSSGKTPKANADSLPAMPSWSTARERHVEDDATHEDIPLEEQKPLVPRQQKEQMYENPAEEHHPASDVARAESPPPLDHPPPTAAFAGGDLGSQRQRDPYRQERNAYTNPYSDDTSSYADSAYANPYANGRSGTPGYAGQAYRSAQELDSGVAPRSPISPASPMASSTYTANPPPSYRSQPGSVARRGVPGPYRGAGSMHSQPSTAGRAEMYSPSAQNPFAAPPAPQQQQQSYGSQPQEMEAGAGPYGSYSAPRRGGMAPQASRSPPPAWGSRSPPPPRNYGPSSLSANQGQSQRYQPYAAAPAEMPATSTASPSDRESEYTGYRPSGSTRYEPSLQREQWSSNSYRGGAQGQPQELSTQRMSTFDGRERMQRRDVQ